MQNVVNRLKMTGSARSRLAAFALENGLKTVSVAGMEGGIAATDQIGRNFAIGKDPMFNTVSVGQMGAALGAGAAFLGTTYRMLRGDMGQYKSFQQVVDDLKIQTGRTESEIMTEFKNKMDELPPIEIVKDMMNRKVDDIASTVNPYTYERTSDQAAQGLSGAFKQGRSVEDSSINSPLDIDADGVVRYNGIYILDDISKDFAYMRGIRRDGSQGTSENSKARADAFSEINDAAFRKFLFNNDGEQTYARFLYRTKHFYDQLTSIDNAIPRGEAYKFAMEKAIRSLNGDYDAMLNRNFSQRMKERGQAGLDAVIQQSKEFYKDPKAYGQALRNEAQAMYAPIKSVFVDTGEFVRDLVHGPREGVDQALHYRNKLSGILRDWEGNKMIGEMEVNRFSTWIKKEVPDSQRREAMAHYMEGNLDEFNRYRKLHGQDEIKLNDREIKIASSARKFFDDVHGWAQKNELLKGFKQNKKRYRALRQRLKKSTDLVDSMTFKIRYVDQVAPDGRLAATSRDGTIHIRNNISKQELLDYLMEADTTKPTAVQKQIMLRHLYEKDGIDLLDEINKMDQEDIVRFIVGHERGHLQQRKQWGDDLQYFKGSPRTIADRYGMNDANNRFLDDHQIELESDATRYGLKHMHDAQKLHDEMWDTINNLDDPKTTAKHYTPDAELKLRHNYVPHLVSKKLAPEEQDLLDMALDDAHRADKLQTHSRFLNERKYTTMMDAMKAGEKLYSQDLANLVNAYGKSMIRAQINSRLLNYLHGMKDINGRPLVGTKERTPPHYVEFRNDNFIDPATGDYLRVNPNLAPDLRLYFETSNPSVANRVLQNLIMISKRAALGFSFFHMAALAWSGLAAGQSVPDVIKNLTPGMKSKGLQAIAGQEGYRELTQGMKNGLGLGVLEEVRGDTLINALRQIGNSAERMTNDITHFKPLGKVVAAPFRTTARVQEVIDKHLWDHVNTGLKATTYLTTIERMVLEDARRANETGRPLTDINLLRQRAAQFTNDAYGNQNWNQMAMNVRGHMKHRLAAALNKPSTRGYIRMLVFAPDWSLSNFRVIAKNLDVKDKAHSEYMRYAARSAILFAFVAETLQQTAGQGSIFDDSLKDALRPDLGGGKQMEISKQLAEVLRIGIHGPWHVFSHKMGTLPKSLIESDDLEEFVKYWGNASIPIGVKQAIENEDVSGILGAPIYNK